MTDKTVLNEILEKYFGEIEILEQIIKRLSSNYFYSNYREVWIKKPENVKHPNEFTNVTKTLDMPSIVNPDNLSTNIGGLGASAAFAGLLGVGGWVGSSIAGDLTKTIGQSITEGEINKKWQEYNKQYSDLLKWSLQEYDKITYLDQGDMSEYDRWAEWIKKYPEESKLLRGTWETAIREIEKINLEGSKDEKKRYNEILQDLPYLSHTGMENFFGVYDFIALRKNKRINEDDSALPEIHILMKHKREGVLDHPQTKSEQNKTTKDEQVHSQDKAEVSYNVVPLDDIVSAPMGGSGDPLDAFGGSSGGIGDFTAESVGMVSLNHSASDELTIKQINEMTETTSESLEDLLNQTQEAYQWASFSLDQAEENANQFAFALSDDVLPAVDNLSMLAGEAGDQIVKSSEAMGDGLNNSGKEAKSFSEQLSEAARWGSQIADAFVGVDQNIARVIGSASTLAGGVSGIFDAFEGDEVNGLALMSGIQGAAAGLGGILTDDPTSDTAALASGLGGVGAGIAGLATGNVLMGIQSIISGLPSLVDGLFESWEEGFYKQFEAMGFDDQYSEELLEKMEDAADRLGSKEAGVIDNIEDFFDETNISSEDEFGHMSMFLDQAIQNYINQGHTAEEAFEKFGDELGELRDIQEQNGYETNENLERMIEMQASETAEGRIEHIKGAMEGYDKMLAGLEKQMEIGNLELSETSMGAMASSFLKSYRQLIDDGYSGSQALEVVQPMMDRYAEIMNEQGYGTEGIPGWNDLMAHFDKLESVSGYIDMMQGSEEVLRQLGESHLLDTKTFQGQESLASDVYGQMMTAGMSDEQALKEMAGWLAEMQTAAERQGFELSDDIAGMIARADEYGIDIEGAEKKSPDQILEDGIASGFDLAIDAINTNLFNLPQFGEGGMVPGRPGEMKLIWAHAGEAVGYPEKLAKMLQPNYTDKMISQIGIVNASPLSAFVENHLEMIDVNAPLVDIVERYKRGEISDMSESMRDRIMHPDNESRKIQARQMEAESESFKEELAKRIAEKLKRMQGSSGTEKIEINSEIQLNVNGRDLVQQIKPRHFRNTKVSLGII